MYTLIKGPFCDTYNTQVFRRESVVSTHPCKAGSGFFKKCYGISRILEKNTSRLGEPTVDTLIPHLHVAAIQFGQKACLGIFYLIK